jgi:Flp pilus assembly protein CpaB
MLRAVLPGWDLGAADSPRSQPWARARPGPGIEGVDAVSAAAPEAPVLERGASPRRRRASRTWRPVALFERLTLNVLVGLVAALLAFALAAALLSDRRQMTTVAVARERIAPGVEIDQDVVVAQKVPSRTGFAESLVPYDLLEGEPLVATRTVQAGEPLTESAVGPPGSVDGRRVMSIPLEAWQAANGEIQIGDQVDVIEATDEGSRYVLTNASVVGRSNGDESGGLVGGVRRNELVISVEVDADQALDLAKAIEAGTLSLVRSTGAAAIEPLQSTPEPGG